MTLPSEFCSLDSGCWIGNGLELLQFAYLIEFSQEFDVTAENKAFGRAEKANLGMDLPLCCFVVIFILFYLLIAITRTSPH